jgi:hypothetical protein
VAAIIVVGFASGHMSNMATLRQVIRWLAPRFPTPIRKVVPKCLLLYNFRLGDNTPAPGNLAYPNAAPIAGAHNNSVIPKGSPRQTKRLILVMRWREEAHVEIS